MPTPPDFTNGTALDAGSLNAVGSWLTTSTAITGTTSNIDGAFPTGFQNFRIVISGVGSLTTPTSFYLQLRTAAGSTAITNYTQSIVYETAGAGPTRQFTGGNAQWEVGGASDLGSLITVDIFRPNVAATTVANAVGSSFGSVAAFFSKHNLYHATATAYTGLTWSVPSGTFTGNIRIYGYHN